MSTSIVQAVLDARKEIPVLVADETATITGTRGSFKFKYATLQNILEIIVPILNKHGVMLVQKVAAEGRTVEVETLLMNSESHISSGKLRMDYDGTTRDIAGKVTSLKRVQVVSLLGLVVTDDDDATTATSAPPPQQRTAPTTPNKTTSSPVYDALVKAANNGLRSSMSKGLAALTMRVRHAESAGGQPMPTRPAEGKQISMYHFMLSQISQPTLCFIYGRVIDESSPPLLSTKFLLDEVMEGKHTDELKEAFESAR